MKKVVLVFRFCILVILANVNLSCSNNTTKGSFGYDLNFLKTHKDVIVLQNNNGLCQIAIVGDYQGRIMTSTAKGNAGNSYGWLNYDLIASGKFVPKINVFGGEDRFWLGPEGGQYALFFEPDTNFSVENWQTPAPIDTKPFNLINKTATTALFNKQMKLKNYQGFQFNLDVTREISILNKHQISKNLNIKLHEDISFVGFQSENTLKNIGDDWSKEKGLASIWILGMFTPSNQTTVAIPYRDSLVLNSSYFGEVSPDRLQVKNQTVLFKGDGNKRGKIGIPSQNAKNVLGSYDAQNKVLTIVSYTFNPDAKDYVNSLWKIQDKPYRGDVINSYNDGPMEDGTILGPFYELETSSATKALKSGESLTHTHQTYHFEGTESALNEISLQVLGISLHQISLK